MGVGFLRFCQGWGPCVLRMTCKRITLSERCFVGPRTITGGASFGEGAATMDQT